MIQSPPGVGAQSTSADDERITRVGHVIRRFKLDELPQLLNVISGDMSLVGPRPNVPEAVDDYSDEELVLLTVRPGVTDIASIVFSDEGEILRGHPDPDAAYEQLIRPGKSQLGLLYVRNAGLGLDIRIIVATLAAIFSRELAFRQVTAILADLDAPDDLHQLANDYRRRVSPRDGRRTLEGAK